MSNSTLLNTINRYDSKRKSYAIRGKLRKVGPNKHIKKENFWTNDLCKATKLQDKSLDDLKKIAKLQRIKNYDKLSREDLIYTLLKSEKNLLEGNYIKYINNNIDDEIKTKNKYY